MFSGPLYGVEMKEASGPPVKSTLRCRFEGGASGGNLICRVDLEPIIYVLFGFGSERFPAHDPHGLQLNILLFSVQEF